MNTDDENTDSFENFLRLEMFRQALLGRANAATIDDLIEYLEFERAQITEIGLVSGYLRERKQKKARR